MNQFVLDQTFYKLEKNKENPFFDFCSKLSSKEEDKKDYNFEKYIVLLLRD
jgi:hypothetical protein